MTWHRNLANRAASALLGTLMGGTVISDGQTGYRAFSARALAAAEIRHDYNYAQVLTLSLWGAGIDPVEVPISYRRRTNGRSFVRYPEYFARVAPAVWRQWRASRAARASQPAADPGGERVRPGAVVEEREQLGERAERRVGPVRHERAARPHVEVEPDRPGHGQQRQRRAHARQVPQPPGHERDRQRQRRPAGAAAGTRSRTSWGRGRRPPAAARPARPRTARPPARSGAPPAPPAPAARGASATAATARRRRARTPAPSAAARSRGR